MRYCPICERTYGDEVNVCEVDGAALRDAATKQDALVGKVIRGRYRVLEKIGEGGMGTVYLAEQIAINRKVALKILHPDYARDQEFVRRFRQEARLAAALNHRNIITVFDFDQADDGSLYIVMEYVDGKSLSALIQEGPVDLNRAVRLAIQIAEGLRAAHAAGVIHRDIKPENIMVVGEDEIKLMDFGIARLSNTEGATRLTRSGMIMGTPAYMAPEQIEGGEVGEPTDIYAFGVVLYEMLSGRVPFSAPTPGAILVKHLQEPPAPLRKLRKDVPAALETIVKRALEKKPEQRQKNMSDVVDMLARAERGGTLKRQAPPVSGQKPGAGSISTLWRRLFERTSTAAGTNTGPAIEPQASQPPAEEKPISFEPDATVAETRPFTSYQPKEAEPEAAAPAVPEPPPAPTPAAAATIAETRAFTSYEPKNLTVPPVISEPTAAPPRPAMTASVPLEPPVTEFMATQARVYDATPAGGLATESMAAATFAADQPLAETAAMAATQVLSKRKAVTPIRPALAVAGVIVIAATGFFVYRELSSGPTQTSLAQRENPAPDRSPATVEPNRQEAPIAPPTADKDSRPGARESVDAEAPPSAPTPVEKAPRLTSSRPVAELKTQKQPEEPRPTRKNERVEIAKAAPVEKSAARKPFQQEDIKPAAKTKPAEIERGQNTTPPAKPESAKSNAVKVEPIKKEPDTSVASIKPPAKQPEISPAPIENRLLSLVIVSPKRDINVKERLSLTVRGKYSDGKENEIVSGVRFETSDANVAAVNSKGEIEGKKEGKADVTARYAGVVSGVYTINVKGAPEPPKEDQGAERMQDLRRRLLR